MNNAKIVVGRDGTLGLGKEYSDQARVLGANFMYFLLSYQSNVSHEKT